MFCVLPFVVPVRSRQFKRVRFDIIDAKIYVRPLSAYYNYGRDPEIYSDIVQIDPLR